MPASNEYIMDLQMSSLILFKLMQANCHKDLIKFSFKTVTQTENDFNVNN